MLHVCYKYTGAQCGVMDTVWSVKSVSVAEEIEIVDVEYFVRGAGWLEPGVETENSAEAL